MKVEYKRMEDCYNSIKSESECVKSGITRNIKMEKYIKGSWEYTFYIKNGKVIKIEEYNAYTIIEVYPEVYPEGIFD